MDNFYLFDSNKFYEMDYIIITSKKFEKIIIEKIPKNLYFKVYKFGDFVELDRFDNLIHKTISNYQFLKFLIFFKNFHRSNIQSLVDKNKRIMFVRQNYYSDVNDKVNIIKDVLDCNVIVENNQVNKSIKVNYGHINSRLKDITILFLKLKRNEKAIIFFIPIIMDGYGLSYCLKKHFKNVQMILNMTDYIWHLCSYKYRELLAFNHNWSLDYVESEYYFAKLIQSQHIVDVIIHRHGELPFSWAKNYQTPNLYFPPYQRQYSLKPTVSNGKKLLFIGTIHSKNYDNKLYSSIFLEELFKKFIDKGFSIDLYYSKGYEQHALAYSKYINSDKFKTFEGKSLDILLPEINGIYDWGLILNDLSKDIEKINQNLLYTIPTKIFTYAAINLPILYIGDEKDCSKYLIEAAGIGKVINGDLNNLSHIINDTGINVIKDNIVTFNKHNNLISKKDKLEAFIREFIL
ncbi:MAG: hypothetical protein ACNI25_16425 [Halarcobacter sp.]